MLTVLSILSLLGLSGLLSYVSNTFAAVFIVLAGLESLWYYLNEREGWDDGLTTGLKIASGALIGLSLRLNPAVFQSSLQWIKHIAGG